MWRYINAFGLIDFEEDAVRYAIKPKQQMIRINTRRQYET